MSNFTRNEYWETIQGIGDLTTEEFFLVANEPILFACRHGLSLDRYLVMMYDSEDFEYVIAPIKPSDLVGMLKNHIPMEEAFRKNGIIFFTRGRSEGSVIVEKYNAREFPREYLPEKGIYFDVKNAYIDRYIDLLRKEPSDVLCYELSQEIRLSSLEIGVNEYSFANALANLNKITEYQPKSKEDFKIEYGDWIKILKQLSSVNNRTSIFSAVNFRVPNNELLGFRKESYARSPYEQVSVC